MCGIAGFCGKGSMIDLEKMNGELRHRGPDAEGYYYDRDTSVYMGHRRLSIVDLSGGAQPMLTDDGQLVISYNGEIYNQLELRRELEDKGYVFRTDHSDTEVLLHGFREWGHELPSKLNGMWAFAIYDKDRKKIFLSRDRFGKKPLFYTLQNGTFAFASELSALVRHPSLVTSISRISLKKYFAYGFIPAPNSLYTLVSKLPGGHNLVFDLTDMTLRIWKYWDFVLEPFETMPSDPEAEWGERLRELLQRAVKRRLMSDVPLGFFLSGGIDSSSVVACAATSLSSARTKTFSIGFEERSFDESQHAQAVADLFETAHSLAMLSIESARDLLPEVISRLDEPIGDGSIVPTYLLCRETRKHVTVAISGDGGDELFAGYDPFRALRLANLYASMVPRPVHKAIRMAVSLLPVSHRNMSFDFKLKRTLRGLSYPKRLWNAVWLGPIEPKEMVELFHEPSNVEEIYSEAIQYWDDTPRDDLVEKTLQFYTKLYLQDDILAKVDRASMMNSLEVRAPFLDIELVDFVRHIPWQYKYRNGESKYILKKAMEPFLPKEVLYRRKKGFGIPFGEWVKEGLLVFEKMNSPEPLNGDFIARAIEEHTSNRQDHRAFLLNFMFLAHYLTNSPS